MRKQIVKRLSKKCIVCGKDINVVIYSRSDYRGGHYFGKIPLYAKSEENKLVGAGSYKEKIRGMELNVPNYDPKPYSFAEYWECPKCYWRG